MRQQTETTKLQYTVSAYTAEVIRRLARKEYIRPRAAIEQIVREWAVQVESNSNRLLSDESTVSRLERKIDLLECLTNEVVSKFRQVAK